MRWLSIPNVPFIHGRHTIPTVCHTILYYTLLYNTILYYTMNKIKRQKKKGDSYKSQWEVNIKHIMA